MAFLIWPAVCFGYTYSRNPPDFSIENPVSFSYGKQDWWGFRVMGMDYVSYYSPCYPPATEQTWITNLPEKQYMVVQAEFWAGENCSGDKGSNNLEWNNENPIFEVVMPPLPPPPLVELPTNALASTTAYIGELFSAISVFIWLVIGIPLAFFVIKKVMSILPKK